MTRPTADARREVVRRAGQRCEYCLIHQDDTASRHQVDHMISEKHGGDTTLANLALSCLLCNRRKASDIGSLDPETEQIVRLLDPRRQTWTDHFSFVGANIIGLTAEGRATVDFLQFNLRGRLIERAALIRAGRFPTH